MFKIKADMVEKVDQEGNMKDLKKYQDTQKEYKTFLGSDKD